MEAENRRLGALDIINDALLADQQAKLAWLFRVRKAAINVELLAMQAEYSADEAEEIGLDDLRAALAENF
jgi:hypothetical protein